MISNHPQVLEKEKKLTVCCEAPATKLYKEKGSWIYQCSKCKEETEDFIPVCDLCDGTEELGVGGYSESGNPGTYVPDLDTRPCICQMVEPDYDDQENNHYQHV